MIVGIPDIIKLFSREGRKFYFFLARTTGYWPKSTAPFRTAFTHKSAADKHAPQGQDADNERLEYLGDAIIEAVVSDVLYHRFPEGDEGFLSHTRSNMVCRARLNKISFELGLDKYITMASRKDLAISHISGDVLEAFVAAIYLDGGMKRASSFIKRVIANPSRIDEALHDSTQANYKSMLVNLGEQHGVEVIFDTRKATERRMSEDGEEINFTSEVLLANTLAGQGFGRSKKMAEQHAAEIVCKSLEDGTMSLDELKLKAEGHKAVEKDAPADITAPDDVETGSRNQPQETEDARREELTRLEDILGGNEPKLATRMAELASHWQQEA